MTKNQISELHRILVNRIVDYINENEISDLEDIEFNVSNLQASAEFGKWHPYTDSYLGCYEYICDSESPYPLTQRHILGESM